jgi:hypothetical protein
MQQLSARNIMMFLKTSLIKLFEQNVILDSETIRETSIINKKLKENTLSMNIK